MVPHTGFSMGAALRTSALWRNSTMDYRLNLHTARVPEY